ncbi:MAG: phosphomannomutase/phosphoglucomutase, partial [Clostridia bacterium]|nr:phosphomannomutase/phosphoglucomutase [Clostridia bacterium]
MDFLSYISGSDVRGQAIGENSPLTADFARRLGEAWVAYLRETLAVPHPHVCIGRDPRLSGEMLEAACAAGMQAAGAHVTVFGLCTTPAMYMSIILPDVAADASIMVTASHLPYERNGFKFFLKDGGINSKTLKAMLALAESDTDFSLDGGSLEHRNFLPEYADLLRKKVTDALGGDAPLSGLHITVDAGNGAGGFYADLLASLGANTQGSQFLDPDGRFPNHIPNPENPQAMDAISECVIANHADLGVIFDTDCDRAAIVDRQGREIN